MHDLVKCVQMCCNVYERHCWTSCVRKACACWYWVFQLTARKLWAYFTSYLTWTLTLQCSILWWIIQESYLCCEAESSQYNVLKCKILLVMYASNIFLSNFESPCQLAQLGKFVKLTFDQLRTQKYGPSQPWVLVMTSFSHPLLRFGNVHHVDMLSYKNPTTTHLILSIVINNQTTEIWANLLNLQTALVFLPNLSPGGIRQKERAKGRVRHMTL